MRDTEAGQMMDDWFKENRMDEQRYLDLTETRITGMHQRWPTDPDTRRRLKQLGSAPEREPIGMAVAGITLIIAAIFGAFLYWAS